MSCSSFTSVLSPEELQLHSRLMVSFTESKSSVIFPGSPFISFTSKEDKSLDLHLPK